MKATFTSAACVCFCLLSANPSLSQLDWNRTNGPLGGDVTGLVMDNAGRLFAGTRLGGIYRSLDGGDSWSLLEPDLLFKGVWDLATNSSGDVFAGTSAGVYRSTDGGDTWTVHVPGHQFVECLTVDADDVILAGTRGGVFHSSDDGETWAGSNTGLTNMVVQALFVTEEGNVFAATQGGVFYSSDADTWEERNTGLTNLNSVEVFALGADTVFAGTFDGLFRSVDGGHSWTRHIPFDLIRSIVRSDSGTLYGGAQRVFFRSSDGGETWARNEIVDPMFPLFDEVILDSDGNLLAGTYDEGVIRSTDDGDSWTSTNEGLTATDIVALAIDGTGDVYAAGGAGVYKTTDAGQNWTRAANGIASPNIVVLTIGPDNQVFAGTNTSGLYHSEDGGNSWEAAGETLTGRFIRSIAVAANGDVYAGDSEGSVFKSTDHGATWSLLDTGIPATTVGALGLKDDMVFAGTSENGVFRSTDAGMTWSAANTGLPDLHDVTGFLFASDGSILMSMFVGVFRSDDNGASWQATGNVPVLGVKGIARDSRGNLYIASRGGGIATSSDDAQTWKSDNAGFAHLDATSVVVGVDDRVYGGSNGGGVFTAQAVATYIENRPIAVPIGYALDQNYPNPFRESTRIQFEAPENGRVTITVYDVNGREVRRLVDRLVTGGPRVEVWDGKDDLGGEVPSGVYVVRLVTPSRNESRTMVLVR